MTPISVSACIRLVSAHWRNCLKYPWLNSCIIWPDCGSPAVSNIPVGSRFPQFGALNIAHLERVMFENGFRFRDGSLNTADLTMLGNNRDGSPTGKNMVNAHDVVSGHPVFSGARRKSLLVARRKRLLEELAGVEVELASLG